MPEQFQSDTLSIKMLGSCSPASQGKTTGKAAWTFSILWCHIDSSHPFELYILIAKARHSRVSIIHGHHLQYNVYVILETARGKGLEGLQAARSTTD